MEGRLSWETSFYGKMINAGKLGSEKPYAGNTMNLMRPIV